MKRILAASKDEPDEREEEYRQARERHPPQEDSVCERIGHRLGHMVYGYFESPLSQVPDYDPGLEVDCPVCYHRLSRPMKTISVLVEGDNKSYFYRVHKECYETLSLEEEAELDGAIVDTVLKTKTYLDYSRS